MSGSPRNGYSIKESCLDVGCCITSADICRTSGAQSSLWSLRPPCAELEHAPPLRSSDHTSGLGGNQGFKIDYRQQICFNDLRFGHRGCYLQDGLFAEDDCPFRNPGYFSGETEPFEVFKEIVANALERGDASQVSDIFVREA